MGTVHDNKGKKVSRVHLLRSPLTDYLRYELVAYPATSRPASPSASSTRLSSTCPTCLITTSGCSTCSLTTSLASIKTTGTGP
ncbi:DUF6879 family protein [Streptomyces sp. NPDC058279]|uniref:DUF6879 family protein n=1 Tax=Streptomyces sp. NPDC058279 TaxID=3346418 RepID=UPI0036EA70D0